MTFDKLLKIIQDGSKTDYQKAADLHSLLVGNDEPPPPAREKKKRGPKPKTQPPATNGEHPGSPAPYPGSEV